MHLRGTKGRQRTPPNPKPKVCSLKALCPTRNPTEFQVGRTAGRTRKRLHGQSSVGHTLNTRIGCSTAGMLRAFHMLTRAKRIARVSQTYLTKEPLCGEPVRNRIPGNIHFEKGDSGLWALISYWLSEPHLWAVHAGRRRHSFMTGHARPP